MNYVEKDNSFQKVILIKWRDIGTEMLVVHWSKPNLMSERGKIYIYRIITQW